MTGRSLVGLLRGLLLGRRRGPASGVGRRGERAAASYLRRRGYRVLARNLHVGVGEADLVCLAPDRRTIVVVEVKCRIASGGPASEESVTARKRRKLRAVAHAVLRRGRWADRPCRVDVVGVDLAPDGRTVADLRHYEGAVSGR